MKQFKIFLKKKEKKDVLKQNGPDDPAQHHTQPEASVHTSNKQRKREFIVDQLVRSLVVEPIHSSLSPQFGTSARTFLDLFQNFPALCVKW